MPWTDCTNTAQIATNPKRHILKISDPNVRIQAMYGAAKIAELQIVSLV
ncbi:MAG: hypothetical protein AAF066_01135 [Pseudomonadota bacterium]